MNKLQKALCIGAGALALTGCAEGEYETGTVIGEYGNVNDLVKSEVRGLLTYGETVKLGEAYVLQIKTKDGIYTASIVEDFYNRGDHSTSVKALAVAIKIGDKVKFVTGISHRILGKRSFFNGNKIGTIDSDWIGILPKEE